MPLISSGNAHPDRWQGDQLTPCYTFVDGNNIRTLLRDGLKKIHSQEVELRYTNISLELRSEKIFWYEGEIDLASSQFAKDQDAARTDLIQKSQEAREFRRQLTSQPGWVARLGVARYASKEDQRLREKEVDVLLAVDAMAHASRGNMRRAVIVGGDLDHRPLVHGLMDLGVYVVLYGNPNTPDILKESVDTFKLLDYDQLSKWTKFLDPQVKYVEERHTSHMDIVGAQADVEASFGKAKIYRFASFEPPMYGITTKDAHICRIHSDWDVLRKYARFHMGVKEWPDCL